MVSLMGLGGYNYSREGRSIRVRDADVYGQLVRKYFAPLRVIIYCAMDVNFDRFGTFGENIEQGNRLLIITSLCWHMRWPSALAKGV
jgi:hypothetical protein